MSLAVVGEGYMRGSLGGYADDEHSIPLTLRPHIAPPTDHSHVVLNPDPGPGVGSLPLRLRCVVA